MKYTVLQPVIRKFDSYQKPQQEVITQVIEKIKTSIETNQAAYGLRIKRLSPRIYEARVNIHPRIAFFRERDVVKFFCLGNHDDIRRSLKSLRQRL